MTKSTASLTNFDAHHRKKPEKRHKFLIFQIGKLNLGLPVESVKKIVHHTSLQGSGTTDVGLFNFDNQEITAIDLHKRLFKVSQSQPPGRQFLIVAKNRVNELLGIVVSQTPTLIDLPLSQIRALPASYRFADTLEIASHVTRIQRSQACLTVFIIDVDRLVCS